MGFASGFKMGSDIGFRRQDAARQDVLDANAAEDRAFMKDERARGLRIQADTDTANTSFRNMMQRGVTDGSNADFGGTTPAAEQGPVPQSQMAPVLGLRPPGSDPSLPAPALQNRPATARELLNSRIDLASARQDYGSYDRLNLEKVALDKSDIATQAMKMPLPSIEKMLPSLNTNASQYPMLYQGKNKNGYSFLTTESDGTPGKQFTMNESQVRQLANAHLLGEAGFGSDALTALASTHKEIADHVEKWNARTDRMVTTNNNATHSANQDQSSRISANASMASAGAAGLNARTNADLKNAQLGDIKDARQRREEAATLQGAYDSLTPEEQNGPKGKGLVRQFNMLNVKNGGQVREAAGVREADPAKYFAALKSATESGAYPSPVQARMAVDQMFGKTGPVSDVGKTLQALNAAKAVSKSPAPDTSRSANERPDASSQAGVPPPPPQFRNVGVTRMLNPEYQAWEQQYGGAWQQERSGIESAALAAKTGFNPYAQNRVR